MELGIDVTSLPMLGMGVVLSTLATGVVLPTLATGVVLPTLATGVVLPTLATGVVLPTLATGVVLPTLATGVAKGLTGRSTVVIDIAGLPKMTVGISMLLSVVSVWVLPISRVMVSATSDVTKVENGPICNALATKGAKDDPALIAKIIPSSQCGTGSF